MGMGFFYCISKLLLVLDIPNQFEGNDGHSKFKVFFLSTLIHDSKAEGEDQLAQ